MSAPIKTRKPNEIDGLRMLTRLTARSNQGVGMRVALTINRGPVEAFFVMPTPEDLQALHRRLKLKGKFNIAQVGPVMVTGI